MATTTGVIDTAALVRSATWGGDIVRKAIVAHLDAAASELRAERDGYMESGDAMGDHMHIARVVENIERLRDEVASASLVPPSAPQWLDAPTCDGLWWYREVDTAAPHATEPARVRLREDGGGSVHFIGVECSSSLAEMALDRCGYEWLRVDVPEAPR